jgi:hypothetical protein
MPSTLACSSRFQGCQIFLGTTYQNGGKYTKWPQNIPNGHYIIPIRPIGNKIYQHFPLQDPTKITEIGIFGLETNHLANLVASYKLLKTVFSIAENFHGILYFRGVVCMYKGANPTTF